VIETVDDVYNKYILSSATGKINSKQVRILSHDGAATLLEAFVPFLDWTGQEVTDDGGSSTH